MPVLKAKGYDVGDLKISRTILTPEQGWFDLSRPNADISSANYPDYVRYLRTLKLGYTKADGTLLTSWTGSGGSGTFTVDTDQASVVGLGTLLVKAINEDGAYHADYSGDMASFVYASSVGASDKLICEIGTGNFYSIDGLNTSTRVLTLSALGAAPTTPSGSMTIYPNRTSSSTTARHRKVRGSSILNPSEQEVFAGLRVRDQMQGHIFDLTYGGTTGGSGGGVNVDTATGAYGTATPMNLRADKIKTDGANGTPRIGNRNRSRAVIYYFYEFSGRYVA